MQILSLAPFCQLLKQAREFCKLEEVGALPTIGSIFCGKEVPQPCWGKTVLYGMQRAPAERPYGDHRLIVKSLACEAGYAGASPVGRPIYASFV